MAETKLFASKTFSTKVLANDGVGVWSLRVALRSNNDVKMWMEEFCEATKTQWVVKLKRKCCAEDSVNKRFEVNRHFLCHHSDFRKVIERFLHLIIEI